MRSDIFPQILEIQAQKGRASHEKRCLFQEKILQHYLMKKIEGWSVQDFLKKEKIEKYALYAVTDFIELFIKDLEKNGGNKPKVICDKNAKEFCRGMMGYVVQYPEEMLLLYNSGEIQKIIIMSVLHENEIIDELLKKGVLLHDMISIVSVLYS